MSKSLPKQTKVQEQKNTDAASPTRRSQTEKKLSSAMLAMEFCSHHVKDFMSDGQKAHSYNKCGKILMEKHGDYEGAIECFNEAMNWNPIVASYTYRAAAHKSLNMWTEAYFDYSFAIRLEPEHASHFCHRGMCLTRLKRIALAVEDLDQAIALEPIPLHYYSRGTILADSDQNEAAIADFTAALAMNDMITSDMKLRAIYRRALSAFELQQYDDCIKDLATLLQQDSNSAPPRALMGRAFKMKEDLRRAEEQLSLVIELEPTQPGHYVERGDIRFRTSDKFQLIEAVYDFDKAARLYEEKIEKMRDLLSKPVVGMRGAVGGLRAAVAAAAAPVVSEPIVEGKSDQSELAMGKIESTAGHEEAVPMQAQGEAKGEDSAKETYQEDDEDASKAAESLESDSNLDGGSGDADDDEGDEEDEAVHDNDGAESTRDPGVNIGVPSTGPGRNKTKNKKGSAHGTIPKPQPEMLLSLQKELADCLFRRAQAKLMIAQDAIVLQQALDDALSSTSILPTDDDYQLMAAICYIRMQRLDDAALVLQMVLQRSPRNEKALYQLAFCQRTKGKQKDAIEGLTKIIAENEYNSFNAIESGRSGSALAIPLELVFETRGTLFHEIQAHTFALADLGRAVAMDPHRASNYYLRGDCHSKLGNYEMAIADFILAEEKQFSDLCSLWTARGMVYRLLRDSENARRDFESALLAVGEDESQRMLRVRLCSLRALCFIDQGMFNAAFDILFAAKAMVETVERRVELGLSPFVPPLPEPITVMMQNEAGELVEQKEIPPLPVEEAGPVDRQLLVGLRKFKWVLLYHTALTLHMQKKYSEAHSVLIGCVAIHMITCCPDDYVLGAAHFFLAVEQCQCNLLAEAEESLQCSLASKWGQVDKNQAIIIFAMGKLYQQQLKHSLAIDYFTKCIAIDGNNAHAFFRRAWSYKVCSLQYCVLLSLNPHSFSPSALQRPVGERLL